MTEKVLSKSKIGMQVLLGCLALMALCAAGFIWGISMGDGGEWIGIPCLIVWVAALFCCSV